MIPLIFVKFATSLIKSGAKTYRSTSKSCHWVIIIIIIYWHRKDTVHTPPRLLVSMWSHCIYLLISRYLPVYISLISQFTITNISYKHYVPSYINNIIYLRPKKKSILAKLQRSSHDVISIESKVSSPKNYTLTSSVLRRFCNLDGLRSTINQKCAPVLFTTKFGMH
jgi:hypothetical protein